MYYRSARISEYNLPASFAAAGYGVLVGTGALVAVFVAVSLLGGTSMPQVLSALSQSSHEFATIALQRALFLAYVFGCVAIGISTLRRRLARKNRWYRNEFDRIRSEVRGRLLTGMGFLMGELSRRSDQLDVLDEGRLEQAIEMCRAGYQQLKGFGAAEFLA